MTKQVRYKVPFEQLRGKVAALGMRGEWQRLPDGLRRFRCVNGAILNWCGATGAFSFEGPVDPVARFEKKLVAAMSNTHQIAGFSGGIWDLMTDVAATGIPGKWALKGEDHWRFYSADGAVLNWHESSGRLTFKGRRSAAAKLDRALFAVVMTEAD